MDAPAGGCCGVGRLLIAVRATDSLPLGLGIDENTALVVDGDSALVVGASAVVVVDGRFAERTESHRASELRVSLAGAGDDIDLQSFEVRRSAKSPVPVTEDLPRRRYAIIFRVPQSMQNAGYD